MSKHPLPLVDFVCELCYISRAEFCREFKVTRSTLEAWARKKDGMPMVQQERVILVAAFMSGMSVFDLIAKLGDNRLALRFGEFRKMYTRLAGLRKYKKPPLPPKKKREPGEWKKERRKLVKPDPVIPPKPQKVVMPEPVTIKIVPPKK